MGKCEFSSTEPRQARPLYICGVIKSEGKGRIFIGKNSTPGVFSKIVAILLSTLPKNVIKNVVHERFRQIKLHQTHDDFLTLIKSGCGVGFGKDKFMLMYGHCFIFESFLDFWTLGAVAIQMVWRGSIYRPRL